VDDATAGEQANRAAATAARRAIDLMPATVSAFAGIAEEAVAVPSRFVTDPFDL
jgi:hypothetical protein